MIDTIVLTLSKDQFMILNYDKFSPSAQGLYEAPFYRLKSGGYVRCVQNPTKEDAKNKIYKPRLALTMRRVDGGYTLDLRIEFSAPKLLFGNNFDELTEADYPRVKETLTKRLMEMGVKIAPSVLDKASISAIHYSKNFILTEYTTCSMIISELAKLNLNKRLDLNKTDYRNDGHAIKYHANSYEVTFYDKIKDLEQAMVSEKRAIEKDNAAQLDLFQQEMFPRTLEVLRMEVRLGARVKIKGLLAKLGIKRELTFAELFCKDIAQRVLLHFWGIVECDIQLLNMGDRQPEDVLRMIQARGVQTGKALQLVGGLVVMNSVGIRGLRSLMGKASNRTWQRFKHDMENCPIIGGQKAKTIKRLRDSLIEFLPVKLDR